MRGEAFLLLPTGLHYRRDAVERGLLAAGFALKPSPNPGPNGVLVTWNRYPATNAVARAYEINGGRVIVMENGYIGSDEEGHQFFSMALGHHLGAGEWRDGGPERFAGMSIKLNPWRSDPGTDGHVLVLGQRGIGEPGVAMPKGWERSAIERLRKATRRRVNLRPHPGKDKTSMRPDLEGCWAAVTWASGAAVKALAAGVPVFYDFPKWIGASAAKFGVGEIEDPFLGDRTAMFGRLAWSQWRRAEIERGEPFKWLLW